MIILSKESGGLGAITYDGSYAVPATFETTQRYGGTYEKRFYVRSDSPAESLTNVKFYAVDSVSPDESGWLAFALEESGTAGTYGPSITFNVPAGQEVPIWIKASIPPAQELGIKTDIQISCDYVATTV